jgi:hypothetical protein
MQQLYEWLNQHQLTVPSSSPTAKAINYTLKRWPALSRYLDDGNLPLIIIGWKCDTKSLNEVVPLREPPVSPGESRRLNKERLRQCNEAPQGAGINRERRTLLAAIAGQGLDNRYGEHM